MYIRFKKKLSKASKYQRYDLWKIENFKWWFGITNKNKLNFGAKSQKSIRQKFKIINNNW